jgi:DNA primase catalytic core
MISQTTIDQINELSLSEVIGHYVDLKKTGINYMAKSPFTGEKTGSFSVSDQKNIWKCFSTGTGGNNAISFLMKLENLSFYEATKALCEKLNITIECEPGYDSEEEKKKRERIETLYEINEQAVEKYRGQLKPETPAWQEITSRWGYIGAEAVNDIAIAFELGYAPNEAKFLCANMIQNGHYESGIALGLVKEGKNYDTFRDRLMFPIRNHRGKCAGFGGRVLGQSKYAKYINSSESPVYNKSNILYGLSLKSTQDAIKKEGFAYLTEGYTDVISCHLAGMANTVGSCGTALTDEQAKLLRKYTQKVVVLYDNDYDEKKNKNAGQEATLKAVHLFVGHGVDVHVALLPPKQDPDSFCRSFNITIGNSATFPKAPLAHFKELPALPYHYPGPESYIKKHQYQGMLYKAEYLLSACGDNAIKRQDAFQDIARTMAQVGGDVIISDYAKKLSKKYDIPAPVFRKMVEEQKTILEKKNEKEGKKKVRKNKKVELNGSANTFPFFEEAFNNKGSFDKIIVNKLNLIRLLQHFGYCRYEINDSDSYTFIQLEENKISEVKRDHIIDRIEKYVLNEYDYDAAGCEAVDSEMLMNKLYDGMKTYFSKDLFARVRPEEPIIINDDTHDTTFFYFRNGFVTANKDRWKLRPYEEMDGSVWEHQIIDRDFIEMPFDSWETVPDENGKPRVNKGVFSDFVFRVSGGYKSLSFMDQPGDSEEKKKKNAEQREKYLQRFDALCSLIGYLTHNFYEYKLRAVLFTDSSLSDDADGRTGKTLLGKIIGTVRSYVEINGKNFDVNDKNKYQEAKIGTQLIGLNDLRTKGRNKFDLEALFNDITEGYIVDIKYITPFRQRSKMLLMINKTLNISGGSQRDRIVEFEFSDFFNENHSPQDEYGHWFMREWDNEEWNRTFNFICYCASVFHECGIIEPNTINLESRRLKDHTHEAFLEFMSDIKANLMAKGYPWNDYESGSMYPPEPGVEIKSFEFDKNWLYEHFMKLYGETEGFKTWMKQTHFTKWLNMYGDLALGVKNPQTRRSNGRNYIKFTEEKKQ